MTICNPIICRCEEVSLSEILNMLKEGTKTTKELKIRTRAGMGICQGKTCRPMLEKIVSEQSEQTIPKESHLKHNFPTRPLTFEELAKSEKE